MGTLSPAFYLPDAALEHCALEPNVNRIGWMEGRAREAENPRTARGSRRTKDPDWGGTENPRTVHLGSGDPRTATLSFPLAPLPRARRLCPRARFSVLVPDGVQGVLAVPAKKVQAPETSGCRHYTEVVSAKQQTSNSSRSLNTFVPSAIDTSATTDAVFYVL